MEADDGPLVSRTMLLRLLVVALLGASPALASVKQYPFGRTAVGGQTGIDETPTEPPPESPAADAGAELPIDGFVVGDLPGTEYYVATDGSGSTCSVGSPCATIAAAQTAATSGDSIVIRGGTYRNVGSLCTANCNTSSPTYGTTQTNITKALTISAYPGETPVFNGASDATAAFASGTTENGAGLAGANLKYIAYTPVPVTNGSGANFASSGQNVVDGLSGVGLYPDQAWIGDDQSGPYTATKGRLTQVLAKNLVGNGTFYVDRTNGRLYLTTSDAGQSNIEVSSRGNFLSISATNVTLQGLRIARYSNTAARFGVIIANNQAASFTMENVECIHAALFCVSFAGDVSNRLLNTVVEDVTFDGPGWMGAQITYTENMRVTRFKCTGADPNDEYTASPSSGCLKYSRTKDPTIEFSLIADNRSNGIWLDQSNRDATICSNVIQNNGTVSGDTSFFWEISDGLLFCNNYVQAPTKTAGKFAGSSGVRLWNNTFVGGADALGFYADGRSNLTNHCSDPNFPLCIQPGGSTYPASDRLSASLYALAGGKLDWMPRLDEMFDNIVVNPSATGLCNGPAAFCLLVTNTTSPGSESTLASIIHVAEPGRSIPETAIDRNVYDTGSGSIIVRKAASATTYTAAQLSTWTSDLESATGIAGLDANSVAGPGYVDAEGVPVGGFDHTMCGPTPVDAALNVYVDAGTEHCGVTWQ